MQGCLVAGGLGPPSSEKLFVRGPGGILKWVKSFCERLDLQAEALELGGVKGLQEGREHSSDLMVECIFLNLFFVKYQNLFP